MPDPFTLAAAGLVLFGAVDLARALWARNRQLPATSSQLPTPNSQPPQATPKAEPVTPYVTRALHDEMNKLHAQASSEYARRVKAEAELAAALTELARREQPALYGVKVIHPTRVVVLNDGDADPFAYRTGGRGLWESKR